MFVFFTYIYVWDENGRKKKGNLCIKLVLTIIYSTNQTWHMHFKYGIPSNIKLYYGIQGQLKTLIACYLQCGSTFLLNRGKHTPVPLIRFLVIF